MPPKIPAIFINDERASLTELDALEFAELQAEPMIVTCPKRLHPYMQYLEPENMEAPERAVSSWEVMQAVLIDISMSLAAHLVSIALADQLQSTVPTESHPSIANRLTSACYLVVFVLCKAVAVFYYLRRRSSSILAPFEFATLSVQLHIFACYAYIASTVYLVEFWPIDMDLTRYSLVFGRICLTAAAVGAAILLIGVAAVTIAAMYLARRRRSRLADERRQEHVVML